MPEIVTDLTELRKQNEPVDDAGELLSQLISTIPDGALGLSAPLIGVHENGFIVNLSSGFYGFINPSISWRSSDLVPSIEGCLSLPGVSTCVSRHTQVAVSSTIINLREGTFSGTHSIPAHMRLKDMDAFIVQHEIDHLNGILIIDKPEAKTSEQMFIDRQRKRQERVARQRFIENKPKPKKISSKNKAKLEREKKKFKRQQRTSRRQEKIRVRIQEIFKAHQAGVIESLPDTVENQE